MTQVEAEVTKEEAIKLLDTDMKEFFELGKTIKELTDKQNQLKSEITSLVKKYFTTENDCSYKNNDYYARITQGTRSTLKKELIEKFLNVIVTNECFTYTNYDQLKVDIISNFKESKKKIDNKQIIIESQKKTETKQEDKVDFNIDL